MTPATPVARRELEPTHPCIRCGRPGVPADAGLCELCNPLELSQPSATQMHGIAAIGILAFVVILAVVARALLAGTGPFTGQVANVVPAGAGLSITLSVENEGANASATTCRVRQSNPPIGSPVAVVQTPRIPAGDRIAFTTTVTDFGTEPLPLVAECGSE